MRKLRYMQLRIIGSALYYYILTNVYSVTFCSYYKINYRINTHIPPGGVYVAWHSYSVEFNPCSFKQCWTLLFEYSQSLLIPIQMQILMLWKHPAHPLSLQSLWCYSSEIKQSHHYLWILKCTLVWIKKKA